MPLRDPVSVYNAENNIEAFVVRDILIAADIEAYVTEDVSQVGVWMLGLIPEIHKPQVWTDRSDQEKAGPVLAQYEQRQRELHRIDTEAEASLAEHITVACEECAGLATFPTRLRGTVQVCPHCNAYIDVGETPDLEGEEEDADKPESA